MGVEKEAWLNHQEVWDEAEEIAVEAKVLQRCPFHEVAFGYGNDPAPAYMLGNRKMTAGELHGFATRTEMTDTIKEVVADAAMECPYCAKLRDED